MTYYPYKKCLVRTPLYPINNLKYLSDFDYLLNTPSFKEAIYIASNSLYNDVYIREMKQKNIFPVIKYYSRACTRATPYGLFAGCDLASITDNNDSYITMCDQSEYKTYSRIDMNYLCGFIRELEKQKEVRNKLLYHINTSLYYVWNNIRYIEYNIINNKRKYIFSEIKHSLYIDKIIKSLQHKELSIDELIGILMADDNFTNSECREFINELIDEQILISNLEPSIAGDDLIHQLKSSLNIINYHDDRINKLISLLEKSDKSIIGEKIFYYEKINKELSDIHIHDSSKDNILHIDCQTKIKEGYIGKNIINAVQKGIYILEKLSGSAFNDNLKTFKSKFYERFEEQEIPLPIALDPQIGIKYGFWGDMNLDSEPFLEGLPLPYLSIPNNKFELNIFTKFLINHYEKAISENSYFINLTGEDIRNLPANNERVLPPQAYVLFSVISNQDEAIILMDNVIGGSSAKLLSRFQYLDKDIECLVNEITNDEKESEEEVILAEILHLPEDRIGNIQMHPANREFSIPYLSNPYVNKNIKSISIDDIMVSVPHGEKVILRSKKYNKRIIPILTTAHNYSTGLPIYNFLCNVQNQYTCNLIFNWGPYFSSKLFLPRVTFENIILSPAKWNLNATDCKIEEKSDIEHCVKYFLDWKDKYKIPDQVFIVEGDNKLYIDLNNQHCLEILINELRKKRTILIEEFLFKEENKNLIQKGNYKYVNEIIMCFHN